MNRTYRDIPDAAGFAEKLKSRKFLLALVGLIVMIGNAALGEPLDDVAQATVVTTVVGYIIGEGIADHGSRL